MITLIPGEVTFDQWRAVHGGAPARLDPASAPLVAASAAAVERILARGAPVYGINTGFGKLASVRIADDELALLQRNIVLSHAAGTGDPSPVPVAVGLTYNIVVAGQTFMVKLLLTTTPVVWQGLNAVKAHATTSPSLNAVVLKVGLFGPTPTLFIYH